jgi:hypothetical protein
VPGATGGSRPGQRENRAPRIEQPPDVAEQHRQERQSHPADDPDRDRRDITNRILIAEQSGDDHQHQHAGRERARHGGQRSREATFDAPIEMPAGKPVLGAKKQGETDERQGDGRPGAPDVERKRERQVVALAETVRGGVTGRGETGHKRQACEGLWRQSGMISLSGVDLGTERAEQDRPDHGDGTRLPISESAVRAEEEVTAFDP